RDRNVTGVQTCALPISKPSRRNILHSIPKQNQKTLPGPLVYNQAHPPLRPPAFPAERSLQKWCFYLFSSHLSAQDPGYRSSWFRSEERRVGNEDRSVER